MITLDTNVMKIIKSIKLIKKIRTLREKIGKGEKVNIEEEAKKIARKLDLPDDKIDVIIAIINGDMTKISEIFEQMGVPRDVVENVRDVLEIVLEEIESEE